MVYQSLQSTFKHPLVQSFALATVVGIVTGIIGPYGRYLSGADRAHILLGRVSLDRVGGLCLDGAAPDALDQKEKRMAPIVGAADASVALGGSSLSEPSSVFAYLAYG